MNLSARGLWAVVGLFGVGIAGCFDDETRSPPLTVDGSVSDVVTADAPRTDVVSSDVVTADVVSADAGQDSAVPADSGAAPTVRVVSPASGAAFAPGFPQRVVVDVAGFTLIPYEGTTGNTPGRGHFHVYLDGFDNGDYLNAEYNSGPLVTVPMGTAAGMHSLRISLRNNDHSALTPPVETVLPIMVANSTAPMVVIESPADNATARAGGTVAMRVRVANFTLRPYAGQSGMTAGVGHYHVYLDDNTGGDYLIAESTTTPTVTIPAGTAAGAHRLTVSLRYDDHSEVGATSRAVLRVNVTP